MRHGGGGLWVGRQQRRRLEDAAQSSQSPQRPHHLALLPRHLARRRTDQFVGALRHVLPVVWPHRDQQGKQRRIWRARKTAHPFFAQLERPRSFPRIHLCLALHNFVFACDDCECSLMSTKEKIVPPRFISSSISCSCYFPFSRPFPFSFPSKFTPRNLFLGAIHALPLLKTAQRRCKAKRLPSSRLRTSQQPHQKNVGSGPEKH